MHADPPRAGSEEIGVADLLDDIRAQIADARSHRREPDVLLLPASLYAAVRAAKAREVITLGAPLHGSSLAALGEAFVPGECPQACEQLVPGSALLARLADSPAARPPWLSLWTTDDQVVQPPDSARLPGAVNVPLQSICPGVSIQHGQLPSAPLVVAIVLRALASSHLSAPSAAACRALTP